MANRLINREFYDALVQFETDEAAQDYYYQVMGSETGLAGGRKETVRDQILRVYAMLFCDEKGAGPGYIADFDDVAGTADRLYIGSAKFDPEHWYRMQHHFPVIDEDNYERFAALVIADLSAGPLHEEALKGVNMLLVGEKDPLQMTQEERMHQKVQAVGFVQGE